MTWLLGAPEDFRIWFLRGLADSDGDVQFHHRWAEIATSPNTSFVKALFESLGLRTLVRVHRGYGYVSVSAVDAARIQLFNPDVMTYRRELLEKLANARTYNPWPKWLEAKVSRLIRRNLSSREIAERILEDGVFIRPRTVNRKRESALSVRVRRKPVPGKQIKRPPVGDVLCLGSSAWLERVPCRRESRQHKVEGPKFLRKARHALPRLS